jgi:hypothetical protein
MFEVTMTQKRNTNSTPIVGDYIIVQGCSVGCHATLEGYIVDVTWVKESRNISYNLLTVLNTLKQQRFTVRHTISIDSDAPEGAINHFF